MAQENARTALDLAGQAGEFIGNWRHGLYLHGCGLPRLGDQPPFFGEPLHDLVADVVHRRSSRASMSRLDGITPDSNSAKIVFTGSAFNSSGTMP
jgi:hypothetical protein